jgi:CHAD domain-containing protein
MPEKSIAEPLMELWREYRQAFSENLRAAVDTADPEAFHDLRVAVKRMRALWRFLEVIDPSFDAGKSASRVGRVFRSAGRVRDLRVERDLIESLTASGPDATPWISVLRDQEAAAYIRFVPLAGNWNETTLDEVEASIAESAGGIPPDAGRIACRASVRDSVALVASLRQQHPRGDLHELRRVDLFAPATAESLDTLQKLLGKWHDHEIARDTIWRDRALRDSVREACGLLLRSKRATRMRIRRRLEKFARLLSTSPHFAATKSEIARPTSAG